MDDKTVLGRALEIVDAVSTCGPSASLAELTARTKIPKPTVRRIAEDLVRRRVLTRDPAGYSLGPRLAELGSAVGPHRRYADAKAALAELHAQFGGVAWLSVGPQLSDLSPVGVVCDPGMGDRVRATWPRGMTPYTLVNTAVGRMVLAQRPDALQDVARYGWRPATSNSPGTLRQLLTTLRQVHDLGAAVETEQYVVGWRCVATAFTDSSGQPVVVGVTARVGVGSPVRLLRETSRVRDELAASA